MPASQIRAFSSGGGVQSTAGLVLAAAVSAGRRDGLTDTEIAARLRALIGRPVALDDAALVATCDFPLFLFSNVGDDSEHPATLRYITEHSRPYAAAHGIEFVELHRTHKAGGMKGQRETLLQKLHRTEGANIPMRMQQSGAPGKRSCTVTFKIEVIIAEMVRQGCDPTTTRGRLGMGISLDELTRMSSSDPEHPYDKEYPLITLRLTRQDCLNIVARAGLPEPPKSSCWFCPFHSLQVWRQMRDEEPELFQGSVALERQINDKLAARGKAPMFMTRLLIPLDQAVGTAVQGDMFADDLDVCESGYCMV